MRRHQLPGRGAYSHRDERDRHIELDHFGGYLRSDVHSRVEEHCRRDERARFRERVRCDERVADLRERDRHAGFRERSHSRERGQWCHRLASPQRDSSPPRDNRSVGQARTFGYAERQPRYAECKPQPGHTRLAPPPPPPRRRQDTDFTPMMSASRGQATSAGKVPVSFDLSRGSAAALNPRALTSYLGHAKNLPELLSLHQKHGADFNGFHVGAFWSRYKALSRGGLGGLRYGLAPVCDQTVRMLPEMNARAMANVAHAFAKAGLVGTGPWQGLWTALPKAILGSLGDFAPQGLSNTVWAFATAGHASPELFDAISAEAVRRRLGGFNEQDVSNTAWAFATAGHEAPELFNGISAEAVRRGLGGFNEQNLSNTAWAFATAGHESAELFDAIAAEAVRRRLGGFNPQALSNTAWAFATAGHAPPELFQAISAEAVRRRLGGFDEQNLSNTAWAFATVGHASPELLNAISAEAVRWRLGGFDSQQLSNLAWAFAVFNPLSADELFSPPSFVSRCALLEATFSHSSLAQLHQWSLWREERGAPWPELPRALRHACRDAFISQGEKPSRLQAEVVQEIRSHDARVKEEHRCEASGYSIDALVTLKTGEQIAVEVDGPSHFLGRSHQPTGASLLKHRQLRHFCRRLESVSYWDWDRSKELHWLPQREEKR